MTSHRKSRTGVQINREIYDSIDISRALEQLGPMPPHIRERLRAFIAAHPYSGGTYRHEAPEQDSADEA
ncbi:hypothetical protein [Nocardia niigatensis]|uniref:hypothetical protein n=1 Tax=Nocardia niigatensis TaxID=209249 RepID=UPI00031B4041|nr:hypothetical protein [Nocardia niigatensis]